MRSPRTDSTVGQLLVLRHQLPLGVIPGRYKSVYPTCSELGIHNPRGWWMRRRATAGPVAMDSGLRSRSLCSDGAERRSECSRPRNDGVGCDAVALVLPAAGLMHMTPLRLVQSPAPFLHSRRQNHWHYDVKGSHEWARELEDRHPARRRHRARSRSGMRQGDGSGRGTGAARDHVGAASDRQARTRGARSYSPGRGRAGAATSPRGDATWVMPPVRKRFDLFAAVRPSLSHAGIPSIHKNVDIVFLRELTEGMLYSETVVAGLPEFRPNDDITVAMRVITRKGSNRVAREAFEIGRTRARKKVTAAHKEPVYRLACGMFAEECRKVARDYPDVAFEEMMIDSISMKLVTSPQEFDVVVTTNQFGDILTDIGAGLVGGLGLAPGLCVGERQAMAQATHGSAPDIAGRNIANPYAMIMSGQMLLAWLGRRHKEPKASAAARRIEAAVERVIAEGKHLTRDLAGEASTTQMGDAIAAAVKGSGPGHCGEQRQ